MTDTQTERRRRPAAGGPAVIRYLYSIVARAAFGVLCIAGMAGVAIPVLAVAGIAAGLVIGLDGEAGKGLAVWLGAWGAAAFAGVLFVAIVYTMWPLAEDWITEWPGYATAFAVGGAGLALMALLVFLSELPTYAAVIVPLGATFAVGAAVARWLPGAKLGRPPRPRPRLFRRAR